MMKAQSSLEFATTYAWALIVIIIVITVLIFYNNSENTKSLEIECKLGPQFLCEKAIVDGYGQLNIQFISNINDVVEIKEVKFNDHYIECPALPMKTSPGKLSSIQCVVEDSMIIDNTETFVFDINFSTDDTNETFVSKGKITTDVVEEIIDFEIKCDFDGDGYDKYGCGASNDCDDNDILQYHSACTNNKICGENFECINPGKCNAYCFNTCDEDEDEHNSQSCGGDDCDDNDFEVKGPRCYNDIDCPTYYECKYGGTCSSLCSPIEDSGGRDLNLGLG